MPEKTQVNLLVEEERKKKWDSYADEQNRSLSNLIRLAVEKEIYDSETESPSHSSEQLTELQSTVEAVGSKVDGLNARLNDLEQRMDRDSSEVRELASEVFSILPTEEEVVAATHEPVIESDETDESLTETGRPTHLAAYLGVEEMDVSEALQTLHEDTAQVDSRTIDGHVRYFKEG